MRFRSLRKWDAPKQCAGLLYFAQILEEMLFDFSLDTYKASVMHTGLLCAEALTTIREVERGNIKEPNVRHVLLELCTNLERDTVAQALIPLRYETFFPSLKNPKTSLNEIETAVKLLAVQLSPLNYRSKNEELLAAEIKGRQSIPEIRRLARSYITSLTAIGFNQRCLYESTLEFFYHDANRITQPDDIDRFLSLFPKERSEFNVVFRVDSIFSHVADAFAPMGLNIVNALPPELNLDKFSKFAPSGDEKLYAIVTKIPARDIRSARSSAEERLKLCATLLTLFHHKVHPNWLPDCVVHNVKENTYKQIKNPINSMHKCADLTEPVASKRLKELLSDFSLEMDSFSKFVRSAQLHSMALSSNTDENQILNLWISLESLVPSETKGDDISNIEHITGSVIPFLNLGYIERLVNSLIKDLLRWNNRATKIALRPIDGRKFTDKLIKLLVLPEFSPQRVTLEGHFNDFHLLRDRFEYLKNMLASPASIIAALDAHRVRVEWQIRRIYGTRNIIVHSGETPSHTKLLIEHTHDYLDTILSTLVKLASKPKAIHSVSQGFMYVALRYNSYFENLHARGLTFNADNIESLILGR